MTKKIFIGYYFNLISFTNTFSVNNYKTKLLSSNVLINSCIVVLNE